MFKAKVQCISKYTSWAYGEVSSSLSNAFATTWGSLHNATLQANLASYILFILWLKTLSEYSFIISK